MVEILEKIKKLQLAENIIIDNVNMKISEYEKYKSLQVHDIAFIACGSIEKYVLANFVNCFNLDAGMLTSQKNITDLQSGIVGDNAVFFAVPEPTDKEMEQKNIITLARDTDCLVFLSELRTAEIMPQEQLYLRRLKKIIDEEQSIVEKIIFILYSDSRQLDDIEKNMEKRKKDIVELLGRDDLKFFKLFSSVCYDAKKNSDVVLLKKSGVVELRDEIGMRATESMKHRPELVSNKKKELQNAVNELLSQIVAKLNIIYNVLSYGEGIQKKIENLIEYYKNNMQVFLREELSIFEQVPKTDAIVLKANTDLGYFKSEKLALAAAQEELLAIYNKREEIAYDISLSAGQTFRSVLKYANPDYHCFVHITHVVANIIGECIDDLKNYHIVLSKTRFAKAANFYQEDEFLSIINTLDRELRYGIIPSGKNGSLEKYMAKINILKKEDGEGLFHIKKYKYAVENLYDVVNCMADDLNNNFDENKKILWERIEFVKRKFMEDFKQDINTRMNELENSAKRVYSHPQTFKNLETERERVVQIMQSVQMYLSNLE